MAGADHRHEREWRRESIRKLNNGYWLAHKALGSKARVVYGTVYDIPTAIGPVDISTFCSILVHLRDPFLALFNAARLTRDTILVTDVANPDTLNETAPLMQFIPNFRVGGPLDAWCFLNPAVVIAFLGILGFEDSTISRPVQRSSDGERPMFSVVAHRTAGKVQKAGDEGGHPF